MYISWSDILTWSRIPYFCSMVASLCFAWPDTGILCSEMPTIHIMHMLLRKLNPEVRLLFIFTSTAIQGERRRIVHTTESHPSSESSPFHSSPSTPHGGAGGAWPCARHPKTSGKCGASWTKTLWITIWQQESNATWSKTWRKNSSDGKQSRRSAICVSNLQPHQLPLKALLPRKLRFCGVCIQPPAENHVHQPGQSLVAPFQAIVLGLQATPKMEPSAAVKFGNFLSSNRWSTECGAILPARLHVISVESMIARGSEDAKDGRATVCN